MKIKNCNPFAQYSWDPTPLFLIFLLSFCSLTIAQNPLPNAGLQPVDTAWIASNDTTLCTPRDHVGIGTCLPDGNLHIASNDSTIRFLLGYANSPFYVARVIKCSDTDEDYDDDEFLNADTHSPARRTRDDMSTWRERKHVGKDNIGYYDLGFAEADTGDVNWISRFHIDSLGNIGIGTDRPIAKLDIDGDIRAKSFSGSANVGRNLSVGVDGILTSEDPVPRTLEELTDVMVSTGSLINGDILSFNGQQWSSVARSEVSPWESGNFNSGTDYILAPVSAVGIGRDTLSEGHRMSIFGMPNDTSALYVSSDAVFGLVELIKAEYHPGGAGGSQATGLTLLMDPDPQNFPTTTGAYIRANDIGMQVENATYSGTASFGVSANFIGNVVIDGNVDATGTINGASDRKLKKDITSYTQALEDLAQLEPKAYQFDLEQYPYMYLPEGNQVGLIAQEVQEVFPDAVRTSTFIPPKDKGDRMEYLSINYTYFIPVLIQGMKEQQTVIDEQQSKLDIQQEIILQQQALIQQQNDRMSQIEQTLNQLIEASNHTTLEPINQQTPVPVVSTLYQNIPNPFNNETRIPYYLTDETENAKIEVVELTSGKQVASYQLAGTGFQELSIDMSQFSAGLYLYKLIIDGIERDSKKMISIK